MGAVTKIKPRVRGTNPDELTARELIFVNALAASGNFCVKDAALAAGYNKRTAKQSGYQLMQKAKVRAAVGKVLYDRLERCKITQDEVLKYLESVLFFNPLHYFRPSEDGGWIVTDPEAIPEEVGILIESLEVDVVQTADGTTRSRFKVKLVSKSTALSLAMRHVGVSKHEVSLNHRFEWDKLAGVYNGNDPIQDRLEQEKSYEGLIASKAQLALEDAGGGDELADYSELADREPDYEDLTGT
jgi:phage terminase small subunit